MIKKTILCVLCTAIILPLCRCAPGFAASPAIRDIRVDITGGTPVRQTKLKEMALKIIRLKKGEAFSQDDLLLSVKLLKQTGQFSRIDIPDRDWEAAAVDVVFTLTPVILIRDIRVDGAFPVFSREVIKATTYIVGKAFYEDEIEKNRSAVETLLKKNGYITPEVAILTTPVNDREAVVQIQIAKNAYRVIHRIVFDGNRSFSDTRLKMMMKSYELPLFFWSSGKRSVQENLKKDLKKLLAFYRKKGFAEAKIEHRLEPVDGSSNLNLVIRIDEGPKYRITFTGNHAFRAFTLKKDLDLKSKGNANDFGLKKAVKTLRDRYTRAGYPDCKVTYSSKIVSQDGRSYRDILFTIEEHIRNLARSSEIKGATAIDPATLEQVVITRKKDLIDSGAFTLESVKEDAKALEALYQSKGYVGTTVTPDIKWSQTAQDGNRFADITFRVKEGYQKTVTRVTFKGIDKDLETGLAPMIKTRAQTPLVRTRVQDDRKNILSHLAEKGYIYATVDAHIVPGKSDRQVSVTFRIDTQSKARVGGVWAFGNNRTRDAVLLRHNTLNENEPVSLERFLALQKEIRDLNCIRRADFKVVGSREHLDELFFFADVEEKSEYYLEAGIGYDTARDAYLTVSAGDRNFRGLNREVYFNGEISGIGYEALVGHKDYDFLFRHLLAETSLYAAREEEKNQTFGSKKYGGQFSVEKEWTEQLKFGASLGLEFKDLYALDASAQNAPDDYDMRGIVSAVPFVTWNSVDSYVRPTKGWYVNGSVGYYRDFLEDLDNFFKYRLKAKYYYKAAPRLVLAFQGMAGYIHNLSGDGDLPDDQLFFLGGISDVRGYAENELLVDHLGDPVGGKTQVSGTVEARIDLGRNFELPLFVDAGSIRDTAVSGLSEDFRFTVGSGIRYMTPVGPVGLLYGYKLNPKDGEDKGRVHLSVGYSF